MGEIADAMINGEFDYETGEYLGPPVGYPRSRRDMQRNPSSGVNNWLRKRGYAKKADQIVILRAFAKTKMDEKMAIQIDRYSICSIIQANWKEFVHWHNNVFFKSANQ